MSVMNEKPSLLEPWTMRPTSLERQLGRLLRSPEGHEEEAKTEEVKTEENPSLVNEEVKTEEVKTEEKAEEKKEEVKEEAKVEPLTFESLKAPEGFEITAETAQPLLEILNDDKMSPLDRANALIDLHSKTLADASEASSKAWDDMQNEWKNEVKADPDIGGAKLQPALTNIGRLIDEFGDDQLKPLFDTTGAGNNVHMIKFLDKIAGVLTEGNYFKAASPAGGSNPDEAAKRLFPSANG